jgi:CheY-like chemotaxis protein
MAKSILVVEDEVSLQEAIKFKLEKLGIEAYTAQNGEDAMTFLESKEPDLVWLDLLLPRLNGFEVLRAMRKDARLKDIPVVIVSVSAGPEKIKEAFSLNVVDYIAKSDFTIDEIIKKVAHILEAI